MAIPNPINPGILGRRIAAARIARGKTIEETAEFLQCSRAVYIALENGDHAATSDEIIKLAGLLDHKVHELVRPTEPLVDLPSDLRAVAEKYGRD